MSCSFECRNFICEIGENKVSCPFCLSFLHKHCSAPEVTIKTSKATTRKKLIFWWIWHLCHSVSSPTAPKEACRMHTNMKVACKVEKNNSKSRFLSMAPCHSEQAQYFTANDDTLSVKGQWSECVDNGRQNSAVSLSGQFCI